MAGAKESMSERAVNGDASRTESTLRVALGEYDVGWQDPELSLTRADAIVRDASARGAQLIVLPEMCATGFTMDAERWAEPLAGDRANRLRAAAREAGVWIIAGLAARDADGAKNAAVVLDPSGDIEAVYYKQKLFGYGGEDRPYQPGDEPVVVSIGGVRLSPFICYDLRFPELFRAVARDVDAVVLIANWPTARRAHWDVLVRARAIENQCYMVAVNRTGEGGGIAYDGGSAAYDPWGESLIATRSAVPIVEVRTTEVDRVRRKFPFLEDLDSVIPDATRPR
jgi:omega-amidase